MLAFALVAACGTTPPPAPVARPVLAPTVQAVATSVPPPPPRAAGVNRCLPEGLPPRPKPEEERSRGLCADHRREERALRPQISRRYDKRTKGSTLEVYFGCDPVTSAVTAVQIELGYGHGGSLQLWELSRADETADTFDVLAVANDTYYAPATTVDDKPGMLVARGSLPVRDLDKTLAQVRPLLTAEMREIEPPPSNTLQMSLSTSSGDFHHRISIVDAVGHELSAQYTGYPSSTEQHRYLGLQLAMDELRPILARFKFSPESRSPALAKWYVQQALQAWPRVQGHYAWWVRERLVLMAGKIGDRNLVPLVVEQLERGLGEVDAVEADRVKDTAERYLTEPLAALSALTGWDPRVSEQGTQQSLVAAARQAVAECRAGY